MTTPATPRHTHTHTHTRRSILRGILGVSASTLGLGLLAACGGDSDDDTPASPAPNATNTITAATALTAPTASPATTEPTAATSPAAATPSTTAATRPFTDVRGIEVQVPDRATRIVAIHDINGGAQLLSLGAPVVGMATRSGTYRPGISTYFDVSNLTDVGEVYEPNLEAILTLTPDLIVGEGYNGGGMGFAPEIEAQLAAIAPVVYIDTFRPVEEVIADFVTLLGPDYAAVAEQQQGNLADAIAEIEAVFGAEWDAVTVSFVTRNGETLEAWGPTALVPLDILTRVGVNWVPVMLEAGQPENGGYLSGGVSLEEMTAFSADLVLVQTTYDAAIVDESVYQQLPAVEDGQVIEISSDISGTHYANYLVVAELLLDHLTDLAPTFDNDIIEETT